MDLVLRATPDGFSSLLVVKTKKGADQIAAVTPTLAVRGPARVLPASGGGLRLVTADGRVLLEGSDGLMWDSAGDVTPATSSQEGFTALRI
ncbi:MAG: hypothetical protein U0Q15_01485 [Kineosporiaceae bacterium]